MVICEEYGEGLCVASARPLAWQSDAAMWAWLHAVGESFTEGTGLRFPDPESYSLRDGVGVARWEQRLDSCCVRAHMRVEFGVWGMSPRSLTFERLTCEGEVQARKHIDLYPQNLLHVIAHEFSLWVGLVG